MLIVCICMVNSVVFFLCMCSCIPVSSSVCVCVCVGVRACLNSFPVSFLKAKIVFLLLFFKAESFCFQISKLSARCCFLHSAAGATRGSLHVGSSRYARFRPTDHGRAGTAQCLGADVLLRSLSTAAAGIPTQSLQHAADAGVPDHQQSECLLCRLNLSLSCRHCAILSV